VLAELSKVKQRYDAVLAVIRDGLTISEAAIAYAVSRQTIYRWMWRYEEGALAALAERSHRPQSCPHQIDPKVEERIVTLREGHPSWGPIRIQHQGSREGQRGPLAHGHLSGLGAPPPHRAQTAAQSPAHLQALGTLAPDRASTRHLLGSSGTCRRSREGFDPHESPWLCRRWWKVVSRSSTSAPNRRVEMPA
jgi:Homeodomain-like domain